MEKDFIYLFLLGMGLPTAVLISSRFFLQLFKFSDKHSTDRKKNYNDFLNVLFHETCFCFLFLKLIIEKPYEILRYV